VSKFFYACSECDRVLAEGEDFCPDHPSASVLTVVDSSVLTGRKGGKAKGGAKAKASAENGKRGGRPAGLYVARILGSNGLGAYASAVIDGQTVTICGSGRAYNTGGVICYQDGPNAGKPVLFAGVRAAREAACACHWSNQRYTYDVARGVNRAEGVLLVGASEETAWRSCQEN